MGANADRAEAGFPLGFMIVLFFSYYPAVDVECRTGVSAAGQACPFEPLQPVSVRFSPKADTRAGCWNADGANDKSMIEGSGPGNRLPGEAGARRGLRRKD